MTAPAEIERLVRIETKVDLLIETTNRRGDDHETRLRTLESFRWKVYGLAGGIAAVVGGSASAIAKALGA